MRRPDATCLTLVDRKKRHRFDNRRPEGYCGAHLCLVCIRTVGTHWERYVHWQAESGSISSVAPVDRCALPHCVQKANALALIVYNEYALTLRV